MSSTVDPYPLPEFAEYVKNVSESEDHLWLKYIAEHRLRDKLLVESWDAKVNGITFFAGLFSAILSAFVIDSYKRLIPDSGDTTVSALSRISEQLAAGSPSSPLAPIPPFLADSSAFQANSIDITVNALWFTSLILSITTAIGAVIVQQAARKHWAAQSEFLGSSDYKGHARVRMRARAHIHVIALCKSRGAARFFSRAQFTSRARKRS